MTELSFASIREFARAATSREVVRALCSAGKLQVKGNTYRLVYTELGPQLVRQGSPNVVKDFFTHRLAEASIASYGSQLSEHLSCNRQAILECMGKAMDDWLSTQADPRCAAARQRVLDCHASRGMELDLRELGMTSVPPVIAWMKDLQVLRLSGNSLGAVPSVIGKLTRLRILELDNIGIKEVPDWIADLKALQALSLSDNQLSEWPCSVDKLPKLAFLWLERNRLKELWGGCEFIPPGSELFMRGNPLSAGARDAAIGGLQTYRRAPLHHEALDPIQTDRGSAQCMPHAACQSGRLAVLYHGAVAGAGFQFGLSGTTALSDDLARDCDQLFRALHACFADPATPVAPGKSIPRYSHIMAYRLDILRSVLAADGERYRAHAPKLRDACCRPQFDLLRVLDDMELALAHDLAAHCDISTPMVASLGRGLFRLRLLSKLVGEVVGEVVGQPSESVDSSSDVEAAVRTRLAAALSLPIEVRPMHLEWPSGLEGADTLVERILQGVLAGEAERDFDDLDNFMADWEPWRRTVRRYQAASAARAQGADADPVTGEFAALVATTRNVTTAYDRAFHQCCREAFRIYRQRGEPGFGAWWRQGNLAVVTSREAPESGPAPDMPVGRLAPA